ncbi:hypothetical protein BDV95DRAFT_493201 [Massariosphaeria phaeospora]|uniref:Rhodopsin domain-containing protein n=1 Tax=Massariosphaeria phaeospora TaxID=100035 RepID=A0A7C8I6Q1_9PLEO|nr:hypothetical protein BDV95DRAFT_493201 [Massariosphaeria phaeospora]
MISGAEVAFQLLLHNPPPDPNEPLPLANQVPTAFGVAVPFHLLAWTAVLLRLYTRFKVLKQHWWDDYLIIVALLMNLVYTVSYLGSMAHGGFGQHSLLLSPAKGISSGKWLYVIQATYALTLIFTKISLLLQYLRLFRGGMIRTVCLGLLFVTGIWGSVFCFISVFPAFPVSAFWNLQHNATYYGLGFADYHSLRLTILVTASLDIVFSILIYFLPLGLYIRPDLERRQFLAILGLFASGSMVIGCSAVRLWLADTTSNTELKSADLSWVYPPVMLVSSLELNLGLIAASIPIFHVYLTQYLVQIFVTKEVIIQRHARISDQGAEYELDRPRSWKSGTSEERLTRKEDKKINYNSPSVKAHVLGHVPDNTRVEAQKMPPGSRWEVLKNA